MPRGALSGGWLWRRARWERAPTGGPTGAYGAHTHPESERRRSRPRRNTFRRERVARCVLALDSWATGTIRQLRPPMPKPKVRKDVRQKDL